MPDKPSELVKYIEKRVLIIVFFLAGGFFFLGARDWAIGIVLGGFTSLLHLKAISSAANNIVDITQKSANISTIIAFVIRQVLNVAILGISFFKSGVSFPGVVVGLLLVKLVIVTKSVQTKWQDTLDSQIKNIEDKLERRN